MHSVKLFASMLPSRADIVDDKRGGPLGHYLVSKSVRTTPELEELQRVSLEHARAGMLSPPDSIAILQMLVRLIGAKRAIEVGVFTGYTSLGIALALPSNGQLIACDVATDYTDIGKPYWEKAGVANRIDLRIAPASQTLDDLLQEQQAGTFDFVFLDADKTGYDTYYEQSLKLLRQGGVIAIDNVLWHGQVLDDNVQDEDTKAIRALNDKIYRDDRVDVCMLSNSDGITVVRKR